ncbi:MAG TPA: hypothetical protein DEQ28_01715 [Clostridiales bacterium]|nr:hypothetical protein [Clostridiales bacterium]
MRRISVRDYLVPGTALACLGGALLGGGAYAYYAFYCLAGVVALSAIWLRSIAGSLRLTYTAERLRLTAGEASVLELRLANDGFLPVPWVQFNDPTLARWIRLPLPGELSGDGRHRGRGWPAPTRTFIRLPHQFWWLGPLSSRLCYCLATRLARGHYRLGPMTVETRDPLGIFTCRQQVGSRFAVTVYPAIRPLPGLSLPAGQSFGAFRTRQRAREDLSSLAQIRPFRPGDSPKLIHWKVSARRRELHVREYERTTTVQLMLFVDLFQQAERQVAGGMTSTDLAAEIAASLAYHAWERGHEFGLVGHGDRRHWLAPGKGAARFQHLLETLARMQAEGQVPLGEVLRRESRQLLPGSTVVAVTPCLDLALAETLRRLRARRFTVMLIWIRAGDQDAAPEEQALALHLRGQGVRVYELRDGDALSVGAGSEPAPTAGMRSRLSSRPPEVLART